MTTMAIDASAISAVLRGEPGHENVLPHLHGSLLSTVNLAEVLCTATQRGADCNATRSAIADMQLSLIGFDVEQAELVEQLYPLTTGSSVGFADRACMALGVRYQVPVLTGDHAWIQHDFGVDVRLFRKSKRK